MTKEHDDFLEQIEGALTPEQAAQLMTLGEGDTLDKPEDEGTQPDGAPDEGSKPDSNADGSEGKPEPSEDDNRDDIDPTKAVILAKDSKHTISYDKLVEAREAAKQAKAEAQQLQEAVEAANKELDQLRQEAQQRADAGIAPTATDKQLATAEAAIDAGIDPGLFGDFSEEALANGIQKLAAQLAAQEVQRQLGEALKPLQEKQVKDASESHYDAIYTAHPDADSIVESTELAEWMNAQPTFVRGAYEAVLANGTTQEVIELFDTFKKATGVTSQKDQKADDVKAQAKAAIASAKAPVPSSLSDLPGGTAGKGSRTEAMADMDSVQLMAAMEDMSPEQIEQYLNRL